MNENEILILLISKDNVFTLLFESALKKNIEYRIISCSSLYSGVLKTDEFKPDLIIIDYDIIDFSSDLELHEFTHIIKNRKSIKKIPYIAVAGSTLSKMKTELEFRFIGIDAPIEKPIDFLKLPTDINNMLQKPVITPLTSEKNIQEKIKFYSESFKNNFPDLSNDNISKVINFIMPVLEENIYLKEKYENNIDKIYGLIEEVKNTNDVIHTLSKQLTSYKLLAEYQDNLFDKGLASDFIVEELNEYFYSIYDNPAKYVDHKKIMYEFSKILQFYDTLQYICSNDENHYFTLLTLLKKFESFFSLRFISSKIKFILKIPQSSYLGVMSSRLNKIIIVTLLYILKLINKKGKVILEVNYFIIDGNIKIKFSGFPDDQINDQEFPKFERAYTSVKKKFRDILGIPIQYKISTNEIEIELNAEREFYYEI